MAKTIPVLNNDLKFFLLQILTLEIKNINFYKNIFKFCFKRKCTINSNRIVQFMEKLLWIYKRLKNAWKFCVGNFSANNNSVIAIESKSLIWD